MAHLGAWLSEVQIVCNLIETLVYMSDWIVRVCRKSTAFQCYGGCHFGWSHGHIHIIARTLFHDIESYFLNDIYVPKYAVKKDVPIREHILNVLIVIQVCRRHLFYSVLPRDYTSRTLQSRDSIKMALPKEGSAGPVFEEEEDDIFAEKDEDSEDLFTPTVEVVPCYTILQFVERQLHYILLYPDLCSWGNDPVQLRQVDVSQLPLWPSLHPPALNGDFRACFFCLVFHREQTVS